MANCRHMSTCPMYELFTYAGTLEVWKINYCTADFTRCERHKRNARGETVPIQLMPNGALLKKKKQAQGSGQ